MRSQTTPPQHGPLWPLSLFSWFCLYKGLSQVMESSMTQVLIVHPARYPISYIESWKLSSLNQPRNESQKGRIMVGRRFKEHRTDVDGSEDDSQASDSQFPDASIVEDLSLKIKEEHLSSSKPSPLSTVLAPRMEYVKSCNVLQNRNPTMSQQKYYLLGLNYVCFSLSLRLWYQFFGGYLWVFQEEILSGIAYQRPQKHRNSRISILTFQLYGKLQIEVVYPSTPNTVNTVPVSTH